MQVYSTKKIRILFLLLFFVSTTYAQQYYFKKYNTASGLAHNQVFDVLQTKDGYIWTATVGGLSKFNGKTFVNYTEEDGLASNLVSALFEDSQQNLWIGTINNGVSILRNDQITTIKKVENTNLGTVNDFKEGPDGTIYIFSNAAILTYKDGVVNALHTVDRLKDSETIVASNGILYDTNTLITSSITSGINKITLNPFSNTAINSDTHGINNICYTVFADHNNTVWIGSYGSLYKYENDLITEYSPDKNNPDAHRIYAIHQIDDNHLMLGFEGNGIAIFTIETGDFEIINSANGLPSNYIYAIIEDTEKNYWMATYGEGLVSFRDTSFTAFTEQDGLPSKVINDVAIWGEYWAIATDKGLAILKNAAVKETYFLNTSINALAITPENTLLVATQEEVKELSLNGTQKIVNKGTYLNLFADKKTTFLAGDGNITVIQKDSMYTKRHRRSIKILPIGDRYIFEKVYALLQFNNGEQDTIPGLHPTKHDIFYSGDVINNDEVLIINNKHLYHIKLKEDLFENKIYDINRFNASSKINSLAVDANNLWLASNNTLIKADLKALLEKDSINAKKFKIAPDFMNATLNLDAIKIDADKNILTGTLKGLRVFNEDVFKPNLTPPKLTLPEIHLFSEKLPDSMYHPKKILTLPYDKNYVTFFMEAISFTHPESIKYKYRLNGLREGNAWSAPTKESKVVFSYLPPGKYTFEFTADNGADVWQQKTHTFFFEIKVPIWRTWPFWCIIGIIISLLSIISIHYRNIKIQKRQQKLSQDLINAQEAERIRLSMELHDSVGQQLMLLTRRAKDIEDTKGITLGENTLENLRSISRGLYPIALERLGFTAAIEDLVQEIDQHTDTTITVFLDDINKDLDTDTALHLFRIIQELLGNIIKHAFAKNASVTVEKKDQQLYIDINDNGKGFEYEAQLKTAKKLGMKSILERCKIINAKVTVSSISGKGTTIKIIAPI